MFKGGQLLRSFKRCRTSLIFHKRCKVYVVDKTFLPTNLEGTAYISKFPYSVEIEPIDLTRLPDFPLACATLFIRTPGDEELDDDALEAFDKNINYKFEVGYEKRNDSAVEVYCNERKKHTSILPPTTEVGVLLEVPVKFSVKIRSARDATVQIRNMEGDTCEIITDNADCHLGNLKASYVSVETAGGSILCDSSMIATFGSLVARGEGEVTASKLQGAKFYVETEDGKIDVKAVYLKRSEFCSQNGDVQLGDIHGITEVDTETGDIKIGSVTGELRAATKQGDVRVSLAEHGTVDVRTQGGNVELSISETPPPSKVKIKAKQIHVAENVGMRVDLEDKGENFTVLTGTTGNHTTEDATVNIQAKLGTVNMKVMSWLDTIKLRKS